MRDKFRGYYRPTKGEENNRWTDSLIVMDTNVILDLYRYHSNTTRLYLDSLEKFKDQLWIPYQVAFEFHRNRPSVRLDAPKAHGERIKVLDTFKKTISSNAYKSRLTSSPIQDEMLEKVTDAIAELRKEFDAIRHDSMPNTPDKILDSISTLFDGRVGEAPTTAESEAHLEEGKRRFEKQIPPGYEDRGDKPAGEEYGDYYLWKQLLNYAKSSKRNVIFATEDKKSDWSLKVGSEIIGPRPELIQEFREKTGQEIVIYSGREFFRQLSDRAKAVVDVSILEDALADVTAVSKNRKSETDDWHREWIANARAYHAGDRTTPVRVSVSPSRRRWGTAKLEREIAVLTQQLDQIRAEIKDLLAEDPAYNESEILYLTRQREKLHAERESTFQRLEELLTREIPEIEDEASTDGKEDRIDGPDDWTMRP